MSDHQSAPPPSSRPPAGRAPARSIVLGLDRAQERGSWRRRLGGGGQGHPRRAIELFGSQIVFEHPDALRAPLTIAAGLVAIATVDSSGSGHEGRFAILRRMSRSAVVPQSDGVEGWLWTAGSGSALPMLGEGPPNLALVFVKPLEDEVVAAAFRPDFLAALAHHSPLGVPTVLGLLARVDDVIAAESAFDQLGVIGPVTDREVAPAQRRHLPSDVAADPPVGLVQDRRRSESVAPPGLGRRSGDR